MNIEFLFTEYTRSFQAELSSYIHSIKEKKPSSLYEPEKYILEIGGKRIRPLLALLSCEAVSGDYAPAMPVALAVEFFHNFSLVHDDIMDNAPLRRGFPTVHSRWNVPTAILCGDNMLIHSIQQLLKYPPQIQPILMDTFLQTAVQVCEGQQEDMNFENQNTISEEEYIQMIRKKTAILLGCSMALGSLASGTRTDKSEKFFRFGETLGLSFQILDDYLDAFAPSSDTGKIPGGDLVSGKKSLPWILADIYLSQDSKIKWEKFKKLPPHEKKKKLSSIIEVLRKAGIDNLCKQKAMFFSDKTRLLLPELMLNEKYHTLFTHLISFLLERKK